MLVTVFVDDEAGHGWDTSQLTQCRYPLPYPAHDPNYRNASMSRLIREDPPHPAPRVKRVAGMAGDQVNVQVHHRLPGGSAVVDATLQKPFTPDHKSCYEVCTVSWSLRSGGWLLLFRQYHQAVAHNLAMQISPEFCLHNSVVLFH